MESIRNKIRMKVQVSRDLVEELKKEGKNDNLRYFRSLVHTYYHN